MPPIVYHIQSTTVFCFVVHYMFLLLAQLKNADVAQVQLLFFTLLACDRPTVFTPNRVPLLDGVVL